MKTILIHMNDEEYAELMVFKKQNNFTWKQVLLRGRL